MKTRSNMPLFVVETDNVKALSNSQIDLLRCGDYLVKKDASGEHAYKVTFKSKTGMCITYMDASVVETQSYDKVDGEWVYNSEDKTPNLLNVAVQSDIKPIYCHPISIINPTNENAARITCLIFNNDATPFTFSTFVDWIDDLYSQIGDTIRIMASGSHVENNNVMISSYLGKSASGYYLASCFAASGIYQVTNFPTKQAFIERFSQFNDGVNRIN